MALEKFFEYENDELRCSLCDKKIRIKQRYRSYTGNELARAWASLKVFMENPTRDKALAPDSYPEEHLIKEHRPIVEMMS